MSNGLDPHIVASRRMREAFWKDAKEYEQYIIEPYLAHHNASPEQHYRNVLEKSHVIVETNSIVQEQLSEQILILKDLRQQCDARSQEWDVIQETLRNDKAAHDEKIKILLSLRTRRMQEERRLRIHNLSLHDKLTALSRDKSRLEEQHRNDEKRIKRNQKMIEELQQHVSQLQARKAAFERVGMDVEAEDIVAKSPLQSFTAQRSLTSPPPRCDEPALSHISREEGLSDQLADRARKSSLVNIFDGPSRDTLVSVVGDEAFERLDGTTNDPI